MTELRTDLLKTLAARARNPKDITIPWGDRYDGYNRFKAALDVQEAGNLRALAREFVKVVDQAMEESHSTIDTWADPAVRLFVNKFESLCRSEANFSEAYAACKEKANGEVNSTNDR